MGVQDPGDPRGAGARPATGAVTVPIYQTSTFAQEAVGQHKGYDYSRVANPTRTALQICLASLEGAEHGVAFASGMAAVTTIMHLVNPGDRVVSVNDVYGGVYRLFSRVYAPKGYDFEYVSGRRDERGASLSISTSDAPVRLETPTNPLLNIVDIRAVRRRGPHNRRAGGRRQHVCLAVPPAPARAGRRHRPPLHYEAPGRPSGRSAEPGHQRFDPTERLYFLQKSRGASGAIRLLAATCAGEDPGGWARSRTGQNALATARLHHRLAVETRARPRAARPPRLPGRSGQMSDFGGLIFP